MAERTGPSFLDRVRAALPDLHPAERRLGEFLFDFPGELASYDAQELAELADVSKATVSRFVRRLGFDNYEQARRSARAESQTGSRLFLGHAQAAQTQDALDLRMAEEKANLDWTFRRIAASQLDDLAQALLAARKVWTVGHRISHSFATYLHWQMTKVVHDVEAIPRAGEPLGEHIVSMRPEDVVVCFALRRRATGTERAVEEFRATGAKVALVTDEGVGPRDDVDWHFRCATATAGPQFNHGSVLALCHQIVVRATLLCDAEGRDRLRRIEALNERLGAL